MWSAAHNLTQLLYYVTGLKVQLSVVSVYPSISSLHFDATPWGPPDLHQTPSDTELGLCLARIVVNGKVRFDIA